MRTSRSNRLALAILGFASFAAGCGSPNVIVPPRHKDVLPAAKSSPPPAPATAAKTPLPAWKAPAPEPSSTAPKPAPVTKTRTDLRGSRIVVDAGHGGKDPGTQGVSNIPEKMLVLDIARQLGGILQARGANVTLTRSKDVFIELDTRAYMAEKTKADLLVSVHADSHNSSLISGATIYVSRSANAQSREVAAAVERSMRNVGIEVRGVRSADFRVLAGHRRPAILVECGYLTNATDARRLADVTYRTKVANAIATGIADGL